MTQISCGSRDAQTICLTQDGIVWSWGDGDFGKLGRGGSEGCLLPQKVERLNGTNVCKVLCGAQFSLALTSQGVVYTWLELISCYNILFTFHLFLFTNYLYLELVLY